MGEVALYLPGLVLGGRLGRRLFVKLEVVQRHLLRGLGFGIWG